MSRTFSCGGGGHFLAKNQCDMENLLPADQEHVSHYEYKCCYNSGWSSYTTVSCRNTVDVAN